MAGSASGGARHARVTPYLLSLPALAYLAVFFVIPVWALLRTSLSTNTGSVFDPTLTFTWAFSNYGDAFTRYDEQIYRSFEYALTATLLALALAYPLAYVIAFKAGKWKNLLLGLVIVPFFITFIVRTLAWKTIFGDDTILVGILDSLGLTENRRILSTQWAVIGGLTYNFLPFMILPIYSVIVKLDHRLIEAARDLGADSVTVFRRVTLPLSLPGVLSGITMVFVPAVSTFAISHLLGGGKHLLLGNLIEMQFKGSAYNPYLGSAVALVMMVIVVICMSVMNRFGEGEEQAVML